MAPLKFEEELKEKLEGREIKPSINAWDRISQELDAPKPKRKNFWGYGIAASLIGLLFVSIWIFNFNKNDDVQEITDTDKIEEVIKEEQESPFEIPDETIVNVDEVEKSIPTEKVNQSKERKEKPNRIKNIQPKTSTVIAEVAPKDKKIATDVEELKEDNIFNKELNKVLETVAQLEESNTKVSDSEIDSLLRGAQREILKGKAFKAGISVDAMALLEEAEDELDETFRDKVLEKLKNGFQKVRTAVADRNN